MLEKDASIPNEEDGELKDRKFVKVRFRDSWEPESCFVDDDGTRTLEYERFARQEGIVISPAPTKTVARTKIRNENKSQSKSKNKSKKKKKKNKNKRKTSTKQ